MSLKVVGVILLSLVVAAVGGWFVGSSGQSAQERSRVQSNLRAEFLEGRAQVLQGRVNLFLSNFGSAIENFQRARTTIGSVQKQLREMGQVEQAGRLEVAVSSLGEAQRMAATFDVTKAQAAAEQALEALRAAGGG